MSYLSLNIFILHRLRNKFLQLILISLDSASWELHQYSRRMYGPMKNPKVETRSRDSNLGPHDCKADALPHDHGHHTKVSCRTEADPLPKENFGYDQVESICRSQNECGSDNDIRFC